MMHCKNYLLGPNKLKHNPNPNHTAGHVVITIKAIFYFYFDFV